MEQFEVELANKLNALVNEKKLSVSETQTALLIFGASADDTRSLVETFRKSTWNVVISDKAGEVAELDDLHADFENYRIEAQKPVSANGLVITFSALDNWLDRNVGGQIIEVIGLTVPIETYSRLIIPFGSAQEFAPEIIDDNPQRYVRDMSTERYVPADLGLWLLKKPYSVDWSSPVTQVWARHCWKCLIYSLPDEVRLDGGVKFNGPPVESFERPVSDQCPLRLEDFLTLQDILHWIYANGKDAETKRHLISAEIARTKFPEGSQISCVFSSGERILEGANIAFRMNSHKVSLDSLKALSDIRKSVSDEAAKLADTTRQLATSVTGALFSGIGAMIVRLSLPISSAAFEFAVVGLGVVLFLYIHAIIRSGLTFLDLQSALRLRWKDRLYQYLSPAEYSELVEEPALQAERAYRSASKRAYLVGILLLVLMFFVAKPDAFLWLKSNLLQLFEFANTLVSERSKAQLTPH